MPLSDINLNDWEIRHEELEFWESHGPFELGWYNDNIYPDRSCKQLKNKLYPFLIYSSAYHNPRSDLDTTFTDVPEEFRRKSLANAPEEVKKLFLKFYHRDLRTIILDVSIIAKPNKHRELRTTMDISSIGKPSKRNGERLFRYSPRKRCWIPTKIKNYPKRYYEFLLPGFWTQNKIYRKIAGGKHRLPTFQSQFESIFPSIWRNYCHLEHRPLMEEITFTKHLYPLYALVNDTLTTPLREMDDNTFEDRLQHLMSETGLDDCIYHGLNHQRWENIDSNNKKDVFNFRILDSRDHLNTFFERYNYSTMENALELFLIKMLESFGDELIEKRLLSKCSLCGNYFKFLKGKKYCSLRNDGRDCGKKVRNKRHYKKHRKKILRKARQTTRELRAFYKEKGVKK